jgi:signal transduction histidine kinase
VAVTLATALQLVLGSRNGVPVANAVAGTGVVASFLTVGVVLAVARPANRIGWLLLATAVASSTGGAAIEAAVDGLVTTGGAVPGAALLADFGVGARATGWVLAVLVVAALFPDGHLAGPRWQWLGRVIWFALAGVVLGQVLDPHLQETRLFSHPNPLGLPDAFAPATSLLEIAGTVLTAAGAIGAIAQLVSRWRSGGPVLRQQLLAFTCALLLPVPVPLGVIWGGPPPWLFDVAVIPLPIAIAVAVLQHQLYDLHLLANRTLLWLALSTTIVAVYALVIGGVGGLLDSAGARWLPWLATGVVAVSFAPLRGALQAAANRITYGRWEQPYDVLADLGTRLEAAADARRLLDAVADELASGLRLRGVAITDENGTVLVVRGESPAEIVEVPLQAYGGPVGTLSYAAVSQPVRPADVRLLDDLAHQLGGVLHARALVTQLGAARERLVLAREEERRRLRRDLHDGVGPALAGLILRVDTITNLTPSDVADQRRRLQALREDIQVTMGDVRRVVEGLRPPALDELGLGGALRETAGRLAVAAGVRLSVVVPQPLRELPAAVEVSAYRIATEAVTNVVRHARAQTCTVTLDQAADRLEVAVVDDGIGPVPANPVPPHTVSRPPGNGLATMRERAREIGGSLRIESASPGTRVVAILPVTPMATAPIGTL